MSDVQKRIVIAKNRLGELEQQHADLTAHITRLRNRAIEAKEEHRAAVALADVAGEPTPQAAPDMGDGEVATTEAAAAELAERIETLQNTITGLELQADVEQMRAMEADLTTADHAARVALLEFITHYRAWVTTWAKYDLLKTRILKRCHTLGIEAPSPNVGYLSVAKNPSLINGWLMSEHGVSRASHELGLSK